MIREVVNLTAVSLLSYWQHLAIVWRDRRLVVPLSIIAFIAA